MHEAKLKSNGIVLRHSNESHGYCSSLICKSTIKQNEWDKKKFKVCLLVEERGSRKLKLSPKTCAKKEASIVQETRVRILFFSVLE